jgi:pyruvate/2-oxoglutarate dehydrogenase complex dihydrolipoamide acyltransferase (E2) component
VKVGQVLVTLEDGAEGTPASPSPAAEPARTVPEPGPGGGGRPKAAPAVRKLALDRGVDLATVAGTGPGGRILASDVEAAAGPPKTGVPDRAMAAVRNAGSVARPRPSATGVPDPAMAAVRNAGSAGGLGWMEPGRHPLRGIRRVTAEAMARSWSEIPHLTILDEIDATGLLAARRRLADAGIETTIGALLVAAVARGLRRFPVLNASLEIGPDGGGGEVVVHPDRNIGLAVATPEGLVVPVIRHADRRSLAELGAEVVRLSAAARNRTVDVAELRGGTFTISNWGAIGGRYATPLIRPPEVGIMGFGAIRPRPFVVDGGVQARPTLPWALSVDHRLIDGDVATAFTEYVTGLLADPIALLAELLATEP